MTDLWPTLVFSLLIAVSATLLQMNATPAARTNDCLWIRRAADR